MSILRLYVALAKILVAELLEEATLSGRLCERKDDGTAWSWNPRLLIGGMTERGTTGAGEPQITRVPRVHRTLELHGCGTMVDNIRLGCNGLCPLTSLATIHDSPVMNGAKLSHHGTNSRQVPGSGGTGDKCTTAQSRETSVLWRS